MEGTHLVGQKRRPRRCSSPEEDKAIEAPVRLAGDASASTICTPHFFSRLLGRAAQPELRRLAGARFFAAFFLGFTGPRARLSASSSAARSGVMASTVSPLGNDTLVSPSVT